MGSMSQYYSNDNTPQQHNREPPHLLSSSFIQSELNSQTQQFSPMSENGYQTSTDQFGHSSSLSQLSVPMSEPPPYDEFDEYNWPPEMPTNLASPSPGDFNNQQLFNPEDAQFFFNDFLGNLDENDNFMFSPSLPMNMPIYPNATSDNNDPSSSHHHLNSVDSVYNILPSQTSSSSSSSSTSDLLNRNQFSTNSTSLSPRTSNITLSSSPPSISSNNHLNNNHNNNDNNDDVDDVVVGSVDDVSSVNGKVDRSSTPTVPSKRKQDGDDDRSGRRSSNPRLSPINTTKLSMTQSNSNNNNTTTTTTTTSNNNNGSRPLSPPMLSALSINNNAINNNGNNSHHNHNGNNNNYDDSQSNSPVSSNSPSPETPTMDIMNSKNDDITKSSNNLSSIDDQNDGYASPTEIKTEDSTSLSSSSKPTPQKSSRKPYKELLTEEEKRANHIASEQKRRNTIRAGFKELTDIIPTLKNVNNSKSTILFKAVDYIKYLERRNRNLKERAGLLEMRVEMEMRQGKRFHHHHHHPHGNPFGPTTMGFGHQRVAPMPMNYGVIPNGMTAIPIGPSGHPTQRQPPHVMTPHHQIYFVPSNENPPSMIPAGSVVSQSNNIFSRSATAMGMQIPLSSQQQNHHHSQQDNVPGMNIPTLASDDDGNNGGVDIDGDSSMLGMNGSATRVGVKC